MTTTSTNPDWIAVNRRSKTVCAWAMRGGSVLAVRQIEDFAADTLPQALADWITPDPDGGPGDVVICGAGTDLSTVPAKPGDLTARRVTAHPIGNARVWELPGLKQDSPSDLMQGGETTIAGFLSLNADWDGVICLPGQQTHWAQVSAGEIVSFQSFLSLDLFEALCPDTPLSDTVTPTDAALIDAADDTMSRPERLAQRLNAARVDATLDPSRPTSARVLGALLGAELAAARPYWLGQQIAVIGSNDTVAPYAATLGAQAAMITRADGPRMTLAGLTAAYRRIKATG